QLFHRPAGRDTVLGSHEPCTIPVGLFIAAEFQLSGRERPRPGEYIGIRLDHRYGVRDIPSAGRGIPNQVHFSRRCDWNDIGEIFADVQFNFIDTVVDAPFEVVTTLAFRPADYRTLGTGALVIGFGTQKHHA